MFFCKQPKFHVKLTGRAGLIYSEGDHSVHIDSEVLVGPEYDIVIYIKSLNSWDEPHEGEIITSEMEEKIRQNISKKLKNFRIDWQ